MSASVNDKISDTRNAARPNSARATGTRTTGGVSLACDNLAGWPTASKVHFVTYQIDSNSDPVVGTQLDCYGIVSGNTIGSFTVIDGTDTGNSVNDVVEMLPTAAWGQDLADALTNQHSRTGAHVGINNTGGLTNIGGLSTDTLIVSSGTTLPAGDIGANDLASASVTPSKLATGAASTVVNTSETTASTSFTDLATPGPAQTVTIGANGLALVVIFCQLGNNTLDILTSMGFAVSGASTVAASDDYSLALRGPANLLQYTSASFLVSGLTAGSNTFTSKYKVAANTGTFVFRRISVIPL